MTAASSATVIGPASIDAQIGERVHTLMWRSRMSQQQLAAELGATQGTVSRKLRGRVAWSAPELQTVSRLLGVTVGYLFGETTTAGPGDFPNPPDDAACAARESNPQPAD